MKSIFIEDLLEAGVHFGHKRRYWNPKMAPYIYGARGKIYIIDLEKTLPLLRDAMNFLGNVAAHKGKILFVGTKPAAQQLIKEVAERCGMPYVDHRWLGGMLTNYKTIRHSVKRLKELEAQFEKNAFGDLTKKEILSLTRKKERLTRSVGGIKKMAGLPDALFVIDIGEEEIALKEANKLHIPVVAVVDTNYDPSAVDYVIPGNDDAMSAIRLYLGLAEESIMRGKVSAGDLAVKEEVSDEFVEVTEQEGQAASDTAAPEPAEEAATVEAEAEAEAEPSNETDKK
ncbi:MAG: 30S ribosomal protein S2 [Gammaproteobacteria bacterium]|nr:30S ribosomal protein S2 [Gammaproteobacteria bacterium]